MSLPNKKLMKRIGEAIYVVSCEYNMNADTYNRIIAVISDQLDDQGLTTGTITEFQRYAGWDDEERDAWRRSVYFCRSCGREESQCSASPCPAVKRDRRRGWR